MGFKQEKHNRGTEKERRTKAVVGIFTLNNKSNSTQVTGSQVDVHTLEKKNANEVCSEVYSVMKTVKTRLQDSFMVVMENLVIPRVEVLEVNHEISQCVHRTQLRR